MPWAEATLTILGDEIVVVVNQTEVARLTSPAITDTGQNDVFLIEGADQPLFFVPRDPAVFRESVVPPMTTAEKIAAASAQPEDATLVMDAVPDGEPAPESGVGAEEAQTSSRPWWLIAAGLGLLVVLLIAFCGGGEETETSSTTTLLGTATSAVDTTTATTLSPTTTTVAESTTAPTTSTTAQATTTTAAPTTSLTLPEPAFGAGTHVVGEDVQPGVYETGIVEGLFGCYWERLSGLSGEFEDIIANGNVANHDVVEILDGDAGFDTDCDAWYPLTERIPLLTAIPEGKWVLGSHIISGTYQARGGDSCYWERLSGLSGTIDDVITNDQPSGQAVVEIADDDIAFNSTSCGEWLPRG
jgi:hypothetical protein